MKPKDVCISPVDCNLRLQQLEIKRQTMEQAKSLNNLWLQPNKKIEEKRERNQNPKPNQR